MQVEVDVLGGVARMCGIEYDSVEVSITSSKLDSSHNAELVFALQDKVSDEC